MLRSIFWLCGLAVLLGAMSGCALQPTKSKETSERKFEGASQMLTPVKIEPDTILIDARPAFEYSIAHVPRSFNIQWSDFTLTDPEHRGVLQEDLFAIARRLAILGIGPSSKVVVVGKGLSGAGEEGRVAWTLAYLGVTNVKFASIEALKFRYTNVVESTAPEGVPIWKPELIESLIATREELRAAINANAVVQPFGYGGMKPVLYRVIDVRSAREYLSGGPHKSPNMGAINIPWQEFFNGGLTPREEIRAKLKSVGVMPHHRIIVIDEDGVSSGAVTMAFRALGFAQASNLAGGLSDFLTSRLAQ